MEKYDVLSVVGEGSYGLVMRCRHRESGQYVAIKKFLETEDDPTVRKMAMREIRMLKKLRHENLVNMIEVFRRKKRFFLVFEYLEHTVLEELEARSGGLGFVTSRKYIFQVLRALDFIHSNDVIHRDIKPENVLVSRQGVIKLCDFGFARPYAENETFTDYVATRWYRSPELLVGDPRYGKEVDIWAVGCLYAEMMTGEPLFPGDSDIDQLFQIVRVLGKLNSRHQILVTRNTMFKGMKQEQNSSLSQLFPEWNRDSLDFLTSCLKMDGNERPDTVALLKHELFTRDDFLDNFLPELRTKINQEIQKNPLLTRVQTGYGSGKPKSSEIQNIIKPAAVQQQNSISATTTFENLSTLTKSVSSNTTSGNSSQHQLGHLINKSSEGPNKNISGIPVSKDRITQIGLSLFPSKTLDSHLFKTSLSGNEDFNLNLTSYKHYLNPNKSKTININNLTFKDLSIVNGGSNNNSSKYNRVLSAKPKTQQTSNQNDSGNHLQPHSPVQFQSLQPDHHNISEEKPHSNTHKTSPVSSIGNHQGNLSQYFNNKRNSNYLGIQKPAHHHGTNGTTNKHSPTRLHFNPNTIPTTRQNLIKRPDRGLLLDVGISPYGYADNSTNLLTSSSNGNIGSNGHQKIEASPRVLQPPQWLQSGNLKISSHGKTTQIGKRGLTDWKTISTGGNASNNHSGQGGANGIGHVGGGAGAAVAGGGDATNSGNNNLSSNQKDDFVLPNCPGASVSTTTSPYKGLKKKLSPMPTLSHDSQLHNNHHIHVSPRNIHPISPEIPIIDS